MGIVTKSRFYELQKVHKPVLENGKPKNGSEFVVYYNKFGREKTNCILNWKDGFLHSENGDPAVQMSDSHSEYWENGYISNTMLDESGNQMPAIFANWGTEVEYWVAGKRIK